MSRLLAAVVVALAAFASATGGVSAEVSTAEARPSFRLSGTVVSILGSERLGVRLSTGKRERVRLIGVDAPEPGECFGGAATARLRTFARGKRVVLTGDARQPRRDGRGDLQAYATIRKRVDLGGSLIGGGFAKMRAGAFAKRSTYRLLQTVARSHRLGLWARCGPRAS